jgi:hypothetical protein
MLRSILKIRTLGSALVASLVVAALAVAAPAQAAPVQFANFNIINANQPFSWTDNVTSGTMSAVANVTFDFTAQSGLPTTDHLGTLNIFSTGGGPATFTPASGGVADVQTLSNQLTLKITENGTGKNLLTMLFTGNMVGVDGGADASVAGSDSRGDQVTFSSDFGSFTQPGSSYLLGLNTLTTPFTIGPGGFINSFLSNVNGQFSANFNAVPAPSSVVMYGTGLAATLVVGHRVRRKRLARIARS